MILPQSSIRSECIFWKDSMQSLCRGGVLEEIKRETRDSYLVLWSLQRFSCESLKYPQQIHRGRLLWPRSQSETSTGLPNHPARSTPSSEPLWIARLVVFVDFDCEFISLKWTIMNPHSAQLKSIMHSDPMNELFWLRFTIVHHFSPFFVTVRIGLSYAGSDAGERRATCGACGAFRLVGRPSWMIFVLQKVSVDMYVFQILSSCFAFKWCTKFMYIILWYLMYRSVINVTF